MSPRHVVGADIQVGDSIYFPAIQHQLQIISLLMQQMSFVSTLFLYGILQHSSPEITDGIIERGRFGGDISKDFKSKGYDVVLIPRITGMSVGEKHSIPNPMRTGGLMRMETGTAVLSSTIITNRLLQLTIR